MNCHVEILLIIPDGQHHDTIEPRRSSTHNNQHIHVGRSVLQTFIGVDIKLFPNEELNNGWETCIQPNEKWYSIRLMI